MSNTVPGDAPEELGAVVMDDQDETEGHLAAYAVPEADAGPDDLGAAVIGDEDDTEGHRFAM